MNKNNILPCIEVNPASPPLITIIWLHGLGADGNDFTPVIPFLGLPENNNIRFVFPNAPVRPVTINNGYQMPAWYDITSIDSERTSDVVGIRQSVMEIENLIDREVSNNISYENILLAGFSQGAAIALTTFLAYPKKLAGVIALSGYLPMLDETLKQRHAANQDTPVFMAHGAADMVVPYELGKITYDSLFNAHYKVNWNSYPMGHEVCMDEIKDIGKFIAEVT